MVDIIGFIQKSWVIIQKGNWMFAFRMRSVQKTMELDREESIEEEEKQEKKSVVKKQKNTNKSNGVGSFFGYWRRTKTGKMKMIFTNLESTPVMITGKGKKFYVLEDIKKREKKHKSLRVVKFEWICVKLSCIDLNCKEMHKWLWYRSVQRNRVRRCVLLKQLWTIMQRIRIISKWMRMPTRQSSLSYTSSEWPRSYDSSPLILIDLWETSLWAKWTGSNQTSWSCRLLRKGTIL